MNIVKLKTLEEYQRFIGWPSSLYYYKESFKTGWYIEIVDIDDYIFIMLISRGSVDIWECINPKGEQTIQIPQYLSIKVAHTLCQNNIKCRASDFQPYYTWSCPRSLEDLMFIKNYIKEVRSK